MEDRKDFLFGESETELLKAVNEVPEEDKEIDDEDSLIIKFKKPYMFEKEEYTELDLSGLEDLSAADMIAVNRLMQRTNPGIDVMPEVSLEYACYMASRATKLPIEFFMAMPTSLAMKVKNRVMGFLFGSD